MLEIYHGHFAGNQPQAASHGNDGKPGESDQKTPVIVFGKRPIHVGKTDLAGSTRTATNTLDQRFVRLPNPTLVLYVFPHLGADNQYPIPGYSTTFPLYKQVYYALPGETERQP
jgi:conjugative transfer region lipoprotein (TIGR03751 family)